MKELISSAPEKHALLTQTTGTIIANVTETVDAGCISVRETSAMVSTVLTGVQDATNKMNFSTAESIDAFTLFMNGAGCALKDELGGHFEKLDVFLAHQEQVVGNTIEEAAKFEIVSAEAVVVPTGQTPRKLPFSPLKPFM